MLFANEDDTFLAGPTDVLCIVRLPTGRFHILFLQDHPLPGSVEPIDKVSFIRLKSKMHHTAGADSLEGAQQHAEELRKKIRIDDANAVLDVAFDAEDPVCVMCVTNWIKDKITLKEALGFRKAA